MTPSELAKSGTEHGHQRALFAAINIAAVHGWDQLEHYCIEGTIPQNMLFLNPDARLNWLYAIHNQGHGDAIRGGRAKAEGVKAGVSDVCLPVCTKRNGWTDGYSGLYIEMKKPKGRESEVQKEFGEFVQSQGYKYIVCYTWIEAVAAIKEYLNV
jgi:hypothetical protein